MSWFRSNDRRKKLITDARSLLGLNKDQRLDFKERMSVNFVQSGLDDGASFASNDDAQRFARKRREELVMLFALICAVAVISGFMQYWGGYTDGIRTMSDVCKMIILN